MEKLKKQLFIMAVLLIFLLFGYFGAKAISKKQNAEAESEAESYTVTDIDSDDVTSFSYYADGTLLEFVKEGDAWKYSGDDTLDLDESVVTTLLERSCSLVSDTCIAEYESIAEYGLNEPVNTITITTEKGRVVILFGDENEFTGGIYMMLENDDNIYMTTSTVVSAYEANVDDLRVKEEETDTETETEVKTE